MASVLTHAIIANATETVNTYISTANSLYQELEGVMSGLSANFSGDAADGYREFFTTKVTPALTDNLTAPESSLMAGVLTLLSAIQETMLDTVDPQLGDVNRNPGGEQ